MPPKRSKVVKATRTPKAQLQLGDLVTIPNSPLTWTILTLSPDGFATLTVPVADMKLAR